MSEIRDVIIIGSGPAGYTAAIYLGRAGLKPLVVAGALTPGGQLVNTTEVENFPGYFEGVQGPKLMEDLRAQALRFGAQTISGMVTDIDLSSRPFKAEVDGGKESVEAETVIISTGASARYLGLPDEKKYQGLGVSACATCDGFFFRKRPVAVVGGGDTACEEALYLAGLASKVYLIVRKDYLRASKVMQRRVFENEKIEVLFNTNTIGLEGAELLEKARLVRFKGTPEEEEFSIDIDGFFLAIGHQPNTKIFTGKIELDEQGYIVTRGRGTATSVEGVFAAGDVADPHYQQAISAAGMGCRAALDAERFLMLHE